MVLKRRTEARLAKLLEEAATTAFVVRPGEQPTKELLAAKAGKLGVVVPEFEAWVAEARKLRTVGFGREQTIKSLPDVTGGKVSWQGQKPKEAKMAAVKKTNSGSKAQIVVVLNKRFNGKCKIKSISPRKSGTWTVDFQKPGSKKLVRACVRVGKLTSVTFTKEQPEQPEKPAKKTAPKKTTKKAKKAKKSKATGRGKAVVVYFNMDNLKVLAAAKKHAAKQDEALATVVSKALTAFLK